MFLITSPALLFSMYDNVAVGYPNPNIHLAL